MLLSAINVYYFSGLRLSADGVDSAHVLHQQLRALSTSSSLPQLVDATEPNTGFEPGSLVDDGDKSVSRSEHALDTLPSHQPPRQSAEVEQEKAASLVLQSVWRGRRTRVALAKQQQVFCFFVMNSATLECE